MLYNKFGVFIIERGNGIPKPNTKFFRAIFWVILDADSNGVVSIDFKNYKINKNEDVNARSDNQTHKSQVNNVPKYVPVVIYKGDP